MAATGAPGKLTQPAVRVRPVKGVLASLRVASFRALFFSYAINRAGDVLGTFALAVVVFNRTGSALATAGLFVSTQFLPGLIGPVLVTRIDRLPLGRVLPALYVVEAAMFAVLALGARHAAVELIVIVAFIDGTLAFGGRTLTRAGAASTLVPHDLLQEGKAAFNVALATALVAGPAAAGVVVGLISPSAALALDAVSFLIAAALLLRAGDLRATPPGAEAVDPLPLGSRLRDGLSYVWSHTPLRALIVGEGIALVFFNFAVPVTVVYAQRSLHAGSGGYAAILATWGLGAVIGSLLQIRFARRVGVGMILLATLAVGVGYLGTAGAPTLALACLASVVGGVGNGTQWASVDTRLHELVAEAFRARAAAALETLVAITPGVGIALGGVLASAWSPRATYLVAGLGLTVLVALGALRSELVDPTPPLVKATKVE